MSLLLKWLESLSIDITITGGCSRNKSPKSTCSVCVSQCQLQAISIEQNKVVVDSSQCNACGECSVACPTAAITGTMPRRTFRNGLLSYDRNQGITLKELLIFRKNGIKAISIPNGWEDKHWQQVINKGNALLAAIGIEPLLLQTEEQASEQVISRRELFLSAKKKSQVLAKELTPASWRMNPTAWSLSAHFPEVQFYGVELDLEKCTLCQACFTLCSQQVFSMTDCAVSVDHQKCTNCSLCLDICPEEAVRVTEKIAKKQVSHHLIITSKCVSCNKTYSSFTRNESGRCPVCANMGQNWLMP